MAQTYKHVGLGDPNFAAITVIYENGKAIAASIPNAGMSGQTLYAMNPKLEQALTALEKADASGTAPARGQHSQTMTRFLGGGQQFHISSIHDSTSTKYAEGANNAMAAVHKSLSGSIVSQNSSLFSRIAAGVEDGLHALGKVGRVIPGLNKIVSAAGLSMGLLTVARAETSEDRSAAASALGKDVANMVDPTFGIVSNGLPIALADIRENGARRSAEAKIAPHNLRINGAQDFLFSPEHPGQLGALRMTGADGKPVDIKAALRDPDQRQAVLDEIKRRQDASSPENKDTFKGMADAAREFIDLEGRRKTIAPESTVTAAATAPTAAKPNEARPAVATPLAPA